MKKFYRRKTRVKDSQVVDSIDDFIFLAPKEAQEMQMSVCLCVCQAHCSLNTKAL